MTNKDILFYSVYDCTAEISLTTTVGETGASMVTPERYTVGAAFIKSAVLSSGEKSTTIVPNYSVVYNADL